MGTCHYFLIFREQNKLTIKIIISRLIDSETKHFYTREYASIKIENIPIDSTQVCQSVTFHCI